nr:replication associated protein [Flumine microvirus 24]
MAAVMACYRPVLAWRAPNGSIVFGAERPDHRALSLPCGYCIGCRLARSRAWAIRCMHESQMHAVSSFVTLTYSDTYAKPSLRYRDFQLFMKRLRFKKRTPVRFFMCGEYGSVNKRAHFHALLFGVSFDGLQDIGKGLSRSVELERLWPFGFSSIGSVTYASAGYVARYALKKVYGRAAVDHYKRVDLCTGEVFQVVPEFAHMSLKPGLGYTWFQKYWREVALARDGVIVDGVKNSSPRYYDKLLELMDFDLKDHNDFLRYVNSKKFADDCTPERLAVRENVARARVNQLTRNL